MQHDEMDGNIICIAIKYLSERQQLLSLNYFQWAMCYEWGFSDLITHPKQQPR